MRDKNERSGRVDRPVIDLDRARKHLGESWIRTYTEELQLAEGLYRYIDWVNLFLGFHPGKRPLAPRQRDGTDLQSN
jgi:hypothetical protein